MNYDLYFPTPIWWEQTEINTDKMIELCYSMQQKDPAGRRLSNDGGWQSMDFRPGIYPEMKELEDKILAQAKQCVRDYGYKEDVCHLVIENFWFNINAKNNSNMVHIHDNSFLSGTFYVKAAPTQGSITFYKNYALDYIVASQAPLNQYTSISASAITYEPRTGKLLMFPGYLPHGVSHNPTDADRLSVAFNVKLIRTDDELYWPTTR
ncbi:Conserved hypothetical protein CHP02466 [uncultured Caudovirales phage]|uniref:Uncharacterized protein n=1 Tax=uncultured Caudovirales phage TaxID=2100421 RepID=A0A6J5KX98_9CAUD|nr:Conserved hypothetical protein CHP02466 [uncultured Caudovirales phage]CAB5209234.1 Conserved hypothetical protein CHP02466 [uncultured Caudovirales phage]